jgi:hypothetical protein
MWPCLHDCHTNLPDEALQRIEWVRTSGEGAGLVSVGENHIRKCHRVSGGFPGGKHGSN